MSQTLRFTLALGLAVALVGPNRAGAEAESQNVIEFLTHLRGTKGVVRCGLFTQDGWLKRPVRAATSQITGRKAVCIFRGMSPGTYGISAFHDENRNGKLDLNAIGIPTEDYCASRDARGKFGPPAFEDARFEYRGGRVHMAATMK